MMPSPLSAIGPLQGTVQAFRLGMEAAGCEALAIFIDDIAATLQLSQSHALAIAAQPWLEALVHAYQHADYLRVADLLEYKIAPLLIQQAHQLHPTGSTDHPRA